LAICRSEQAQWRLTGADKSPAVSIATTAAEKVGSRSSVERLIGTTFFGTMVEGLSCACIVEHIGKSSTVYWLYIQLLLFLIIDSVVSF
jgi:hypothetical protein